MLIGLRAKNKLPFIDGSCRRPEATSNMMPQWERCNAMVMSWIMNAVSKEILGGIVYSTDAVTVWTDLKDRFDTINGSRIFSIHRVIARLVQGATTVSVYYSKLRQLWDEYASLVILPRCDCESARKYLEHDQQHKLLQFLMGLNESYAPVRSQILLMTLLPSVGQAYSMVAQEESHRSLMAATPQVIEPATSVFYSAKGRFLDKRRDLLTCEHCHMIGHSKENCFKIIGYPVGHRLHKPGNKNQSSQFQKDGYKNRNANMSNNCAPQTESTVSSHAALFTPEQYAEILKLLNKDRVLDISNTPEVNMAGTSSISPSSLNSQWIIDSGANDHMVGRHSLLLPSHSCGSPRGSVKMPDGNTTNVSTLGSIAITDSIILHNVLQDLHHGKILGIGKERNGLYLFDSSSFPSQLQTTYLWGPFRNATYNGERYFLTIVDEFTRITWNFLMQSKLDLFPIIRNFIALIHNQFSTTIKIIRTDNALDFFKSEFYPHSLPYVPFFVILQIVSHIPTFLASISADKEPSTYHEAITDPRWKAAMDQELEALRANGTWVLCQLPPGKSAIGNKWVFKIKYNSDGSVDRFKARLVAKGYTQQPSIDYHYTFSPVAKIVTVRCVLSLAAHMHWPLHQMDVTNAFLQGALDEEIYMHLPQGFRTQGEPLVCYPGSFLAWCFS
ncbi:uncharacterized protein LOC142538780 [Primulina tabacum]|uniref:uncharacterized protein LOC142538780 n=1 Tax=Primulina tabacum TaxID=48773 RepID=UPI003F598BC9